MKDLLEKTPPYSSNNLAQTTGPSTLAGSDHWSRTLPPQTTQVNSPLQAFSQKSDKWVRNNQTMKSPHGRVNTFTAIADCL